MNRQQLENKIAKLEATARSYEVLCSPAAAAFCKKAEQLRRKLKRSQQRVVDPVRACQLEQEEWLRLHPLSTSRYYDNSGDYDPPDVRWLRYFTRTGRLRYPGRRRKHVKALREAAVQVHQALQQLADRIERWDASATKSTAVGVKAE